MNTNKKIILLGLILLIIAGVVVIALKGLNVSLMFRNHESINIYIDKEVDFNEFKDLCKEVFGNKKYVLKKLELFGEAVNLSKESFTDEEKETLINKINEKYEKEYTVNDLTINEIPNIRIRDIIRPYVKPITISAVLIIAYMLIRYRKTSVFEIIGKLLLLIVLTEVTVLSLIAILRIPVSSVVINLMLSLAVIELVVYNYRKEKLYNK